MSALKKITDDVCFDEELGFRLKMLRQSHRMSQEQLGELLGTSYQQIQRYESGSNRISPAKLFSCAKIFQTPISYFFDAETYEELYKFDKKIITIASAIASLPNPDIAIKLYQLALSMGEPSNKQ